MTRAAKVRAVVALALTALAAILAMTQQPRLGIDLRGQTQIVSKPATPPRSKPTPKPPTTRWRCCASRADALGVSEPTLVRSGKPRIIVELPGVLDPNQAAEVLGRTAQLTFHPVKGRPAPGTGAAGPGRLRRRTGEQARGRADADTQQGPGWSVAVDFRDEGRKNGGN